VLRCCFLNRADFSSASANSSAIRAEAPERRPHIISRTPTLPRLNARAPRTTTGCAVCPLSFGLVEARSLVPSFRDAVGLSLGGRGMCPQGRPSVRPHRHRRLLVKLGPIPWTPGAYPSIRTALRFPGKTLAGSVSVRRAQVVDLSRLLKS